MINTYSTLKRINDNIFGKNLPPVGYTLLIPIGSVQINNQYYSIQNDHLKKFRTKI